LSAMKAIALVLAESSDLVAWLASVFAESVAFVHLDAEPFETLIDRIRASGGADLMFCEIAPEAATERVALVERLTEQLPRLPVVGIGMHDDAQLILAAMRAGARDFFVRGRDAGLTVQLVRILRRSAVVPQNTSSAAQRAKVYSILSGRPYDGTAFLGGHLGLALQELLSKSGEHVLLIDLATPPGAAAIFLNLNPSYSILDAINDTARVDRNLTESAFSRHPSGLHVLSLPEDLLGTPDLHADEVVQLLQVLRGLFDVIVLTIDGNLPTKLIARLIRDCERALLLTDQSILKSRYNRHLLRALRVEDCPLDRMGLIVDNYRRHLGLEPQNLSELFELPLLATLHTEGHHRIVSMNSGEPMFTLARNDPYCLNVRKLAAALYADKTIDIKPISALARWLAS